MDRPEIPGALVLVAAAAYPGEALRAADRALAVPVVGDGLAAMPGPLAEPGTIATIVQEMIGPDGAHVRPTSSRIGSSSGPTPRSVPAHP